MKYYRFVDAYYESFREAGGKYRVDINILHLDADRTRKFTEIFRQEICHMISVLQGVADDAENLGKLFDLIFEDSNTNKSEAKIYLDVTPSPLV